MSGSGSIRQVRIRWTESHDPSDDDQLLDPLLEAALDEGPLLVLSCAKHGPKPRPSPQVFRNVGLYKAHLGHYGDALTDERWAGIVVPSDRGDVAESALARIRVLATPVVQSRLKRHPKPIFDYHTLAETLSLTEAVLIRNQGEVFMDVVQAYPMLQGLMILESAALRANDDETSTPRKFTL